MSEEVEQTAAKKMKLAEVVPVPKEGHCHAWIQRKKRFCKMTVGKKRKYCGEHATSEAELTDDPRVPCPLDPKHSVNEKNLEKHLKVCNAKVPEVLPAYIKLRCNIDEDVSADDGKSFRLQELPQHELDSVIKIVTNLFDSQIAGAIETNYLTHEVLNQELANETYGHEKRKHIIQTSSILGIMKKENFLQPRTCFIEYGAGKAALTFWLATAVKTLVGAKVLVVDRASHRHKKDNLIRDRDLVERIRADIADLSLKGLDMLSGCDSLVGVSKHLCGGATDLALRCMVRGNEDGVKSNGFLICVCCHHQCTWETFVGKDWLIKNNIDKKTFGIMIKIVSWCTCGDGLSREKSVNEEKEAERKLTEEIGWKCKRVLDQARLEFMVQNGYDAKLSFYAEKSVTLENICIIGKLRPTVE